MMKRIKQLLNTIPIYSIVPLLFTVLWNQIVYNGAHLIAGGWHHHDITLAWEEQIPFQPWSVLVYFGAFIFWVVLYLYCACQEKEKAHRLLCADFLSKAVCLVFFLFLPTTNIRPEIVDGGVFGALMRFLYWVDDPANLFPSIHCLVSWLCFIGIRRDEKRSVECKLLVLAGAVAVCVSTLTTKQHVFWDVVSGIALAELTYWVAGRKPVLNTYSKLADKLTPRWLKKRRGLLEEPPLPPS